jgi:DNA replication protein DnaC
MIQAMPEDEREYLISQIIPPLYKNARIEHLTDNLQSKIKTLDKYKGLLLWGITGAGKTYALSSLARQYILSGYIVSRITYEMLCLRIRDSFKTDKETELSIIKPYLESEKFFLEDVGTTKSEGKQESDFSVRTLLVLLDYRLENQLPTFVSTNRPIEELENTFDSRIVSRLIQACEIIKLSGKDRRKTKG